MTLLGIVVLLALASWMREAQGLILCLGNSFWMVVGEGDCVYIEVKEVGLAAKGFRVYTSMLLTFSWRDGRAV